jgi:hypothetical protein
MSDRKAKRASFNLAEYVNKQAKRSGVPERVENAAVLAQVAALVVSLAAPKSS